MIDRPDRTGVHGTDVTLPIDDAMRRAAAVASVTHRPGHIDELLTALKAWRDELDAWCRRRTIEQSAHVDRDPIAYDQARAAASDVCDLAHNVRRIDHRIRNLTALSAAADRPTGLVDRAASYD